MWVFFAKEGHYYPMKDRQVSLKNKIKNLVDLETKNMNKQQKMNKNDKGRISKNEKVANIIKSYFQKVGKYCIFELTVTRWSPNFCVFTYRTEKIVYKSDDSFLGPNVARGLISSIISSSCSYNEASLDLSLSKSCENLHSDHPGFAQARGPTPGRISLDSWLFALVRCVCRISWST